MAKYYYMFSSATEINCEGENDEDKSNLLIHIGNTLAGQDEESIAIAIQPTIVRLPGNIEDILERDYAKPPVEVEDDDGIEGEAQLIRKTYECQTCDRHFYGRGVVYRFCPYCGQRFK